MAHATFVLQSPMWRMFSDYMRRVACFIKSMKDPKKFEEFRLYLKHLPDVIEEERDLHASTSKPTTVNQHVSKFISDVAYGLL